jgi:hypothetical protein
MVGIPSVGLSQLGSIPQEWIPEFDASAQTKTEGLPLLRQKMMCLSPSGLVFLTLPDLPFV